MKGARARSARCRCPRLLLVSVCAAWAACAACAHAPNGTADGSAGGTRGHVRAIEPDSVTSGLWRMDDVVGVSVADAGPFRLGGTAGVDTRSGFGRIGRAREFTRSVNSFVLVPYNPVLEAGDRFTVEAWINPAEFGDYEDTPIAARWSPEGLQYSWLFSIAGKNRLIPARPGPGDHVSLLRQGGAAGKVMFALQPEQAGTARAFFSTRPVELGRWTHVAASYDGQVVRIYLNDQLDAQYASPGRVRASDAPLMIGNSLDPRWLTTFSGDLRVGPVADQTAYYAFVGLIDEVRISASARTDFPYARGD
jgi:hypothetical protein